MVSISRRFVWALYAGIVAVMGLFGIVYSIHKFTSVTVNPRVLRIFHINSEAAIPAWYNSVLLVLAAFIALVGVATCPRRERAGWMMLVVLLTYLSVDEMAGIHETFGLITEMFPQLDIGTFHWVVPGIILAAIAFIFVVRFGRHLPPRLARGLLIAMVLYGAGAVGVELLTGLLIRGFPTSFVVVEVVQPALQILEETLEMVACVLAISALLRVFSQQPERIGALADHFAAPASEH